MSKQSLWTSKADSTFITHETGLYLTWRRALPLVNTQCTFKPCPLIRRSTETCMHSLYVVKLCMWKRPGSFYLTGLGWGVFIGFFSVCPPVDLSHSFSPASTYITVYPLSDVHSFMLIWQHLNVSSSCLHVHHGHFSVKVVAAILLVQSK